MLNGFIFVFTHPLNKGHFVRTLVRVLWWKLNQLFFQFPAIIPLTDKIQCICYPNLSYSGLIVYTRWPDYEEWSFLSKFLKKNSIFFDIGAHSGDYSLLAADKITSGSIYAFEPDPRLLSNLHQNISLNSLENIISVIPSAVSDKKGTLSFTLSEHSETSHLSVGSEAHQGKKVEVSSVTLDQFAQNKNLSFIDVVKIDVEGAEGLVFSGAKRLLKEQRIGIILFELNVHSAEYGSSSMDILHALENNEYTLYSLSDSKLTRISPHDTFSQTLNLIAVSKKENNNPVIRSFT